MKTELSALHRQRLVLVYVRQSTPGQVLSHLEGKRRQYELVELARSMGCERVEVIDDDLGRSGDGYTERPGFQRLVALVCGGTVGAVFCLEASRLARNGRDWHNLLHLCGLADVAIVDPEGVYDPNVGNDRLLLGLKGTMSEFELSLLRQRSLEARNQKAARGDLKFRLPAGLEWGPGARIEKAADEREREAIALTLRKFEELGSARQVMLWLHEADIELPVREYGGGVVWRRAYHGLIVRMINNPLYAGAYVHGRKESRTHVVDGQGRKTDGHAKPIERWGVLLRDHFEAYISWEQYERNLATLASNAHRRPDGRKKDGRGGQALLSGLLRCAHCGRRPQVYYRNQAHRYQCRTDDALHGGGRCISFGGKGPDGVIAKAVLEAVQPCAIDAAVEAAARGAEQRAEQRRRLELDCEQARHQARLAQARYEAVDPDNRLVASTLEARWNAALEKIHQLEARLAQFDEQTRRTPMPDRKLLMSLANDLHAVWDAPTTTPRMRQRLVRILIEEIIVGLDEDADTLSLTVHWVGGRHTRYKLPKKARSRIYTDSNAIAVLRQMAGQFTDDQIALTLNRSGYRTGHGNTWNRVRVQDARYNHNLPPFVPGSVPSTITAMEAAELLGVCSHFVCQLILEGTLPGRQVAKNAPWEIAPGDLSIDAVVTAVANRRRRRPRRETAPEQLSLISTSWLEEAE
jgi:DNA invertase Pin-like site-specific DNA recombinase